MKTVKKIPESLRLEFLEKFLANNFALLDAEDNTSRLFNRRSIADLPLLRTLLPIHLKSLEPSSCPKKQVHGKWCTLLFYNYWSFNSLLVANWTC